METETEMQRAESALLQSVQHYEGVLKFMGQMDQDMGTADPVTLQNFCISLQEFQEQAMQCDRQISALMRGKFLETESIQALTRKRAFLLKEILLLNERITAKATGVKSLLAHELRVLRTGHSALSGYSQSQQPRGRITNCTS